MRTHAIDAQLVDLVNAVEQAVPVLARSALASLMPAGPPQVGEQHDLARQSGGDLRLRTTPGGGARFQLLLPERDASARRPRKPFITVTARVGTVQAALEGGPG